MCALTCAAAFPADAPLTPLTVCDVVRDLAAQDGKALAVLGRYSFRASGRTLAEQACDPAVAIPPQLRLVENRPDAPRPPDAPAKAGNLPAPTDAQVNVAIGRGLAFLYKQAGEGMAFADTGVASPCGNSSTS